ncbi:MAG: hypothetical protein ABIT08_15880 [Bacteroidia bacterium]
MKEKVSTKVRLFMLPAIITLRQTAVLTSKRLANKTRKAKIIQTMLRLRIILFTLFCGCIGGCGLAIKDKIVDNYYLIAADEPYQLNLESRTF